MSKFSTIFVQFTNQRSVRYNGFLTNIKHNVRNYY